MNSILNSIVSLQSSLNNLLDALYNRSWNYIPNSLDRYFEKLKEIEKNNQDQGKKSTDFIGNKEERLLLHDVLMKSGSRFLSKDDKSYISKKGIESSFKKPFPNQERVTPNNYPKLYNTVKNISKEIGDELPAVVVFDLTDKHKFPAISMSHYRTLAFSRDFINFLNDDELKYIVGHEYSHFFDSVLQEKSLASLVGEVINTANQLLHQDGFSCKSILFSFSTLSVLKEYVIEKKYPDISKIDSDYFDNMDYRKLAINIKDALEILPSIRLSSHNSKSREYVADAVGAYFSGEEAAVSGLRKMIFRTYEKDKNNGENITDNEFNHHQRKIVKEVLKDFARKKWNRFITNTSSHPNFVDRVTAIERGSFSESVRARLEESKNPDDFER